MQGGGAVCPRLGHSNAPRSCCMRVAGECTLEERWRQSTWREEEQGMDRRSYAFDDRDIGRYYLVYYKHFVFAMLDVDVSQKIVDFLVK